MLRLIVAIKKMPPAHPPSAQRPSGQHAGGPGLTGGASSTAVRPPVLLQLLLLPALLAAPRSTRPAHLVVSSLLACPALQGVLSAPMVAIILGRDVFLFTGAFAVRFKSLGWRWPGWAEFFRVAPPPPPPASPCPTPPTPAAAPLTRQQQGQAAAAASVQAAPFAEPLYISKVNTAFQLGLVGACISRAWLGWPGEEAVWYASVATATTTVWSCAAYVRAYTQGKLPLAGRV